MPCQSLELSSLLSCCVASQHASAGGGDLDVLASAIVQDGRSYHLSTFVDAAALLGRPDFIAAHPSAVREQVRGRCFGMITESMGAVML